MEKELELKYLSAYPVGLKLLQDTSNWHEPLPEKTRIVEYCGYQNLTYVSVYYNILDVKGGGSDYLDQFKLILKPLSDLRKTGVIDELKGLLRESEGYIMWSDIDKTPLDYPYWAVEILLKNHFDVFGLIEKGEAIDINTLPTN